MLDYFPLRLFFLLLLIFKPFSPGTREAGFVHAISAAGVAYAVTRACSAGKLGNKCGCDTKYRGDSKKGFKWAGCSDNINAGMKFSRDFVDARERGRKVGGQARVLMNLHNNEAGRQVGQTSLSITAYMLPKLLTSKPFQVLCIVLRFVLGSH